VELLQKTLTKIKDIDHGAAEKAQARLDGLIKPRGSLGKLEEIVVQLAGIQSNPRPQLGPKLLVIMAADHGVAKEGVTAFPSDGSTKMLLNFLNQGAAVNVLAQYTNTRILLVDVGLNGDPIVHPNLCVRRIKPGSGNISREAAMSETEAIAAIETGIELVEREADAGVGLVAVGELGIGNTTPSTAILACISGEDIQAITGRGTGLDDGALLIKQQVIQKALEINQPDQDNPLDILSKVGGLEIAALTGVMLSCAARRVPVVLDGFVSGAAAMLACRMNARCSQYMIASHLSEETGHRTMLTELGLRPLLDLGLRIGEGTGAVLALPLIESVVKIINETASQAEVGISI